MSIQKYKMLKILFEYEYILYLENLRVWPALQLWPGARVTGVTHCPASTHTNLGVSIL